MKSNLFTSMKAPLLFTAILALGLTSGRLFDGLRDRLIPSAEAHPGNGNGNGNGNWNGNGNGGQCGLHSIQGKWGLVLHGTIGEDDIVAVGAETCDGAGHCTGHATANIGGFVAEDTFTSMDVINPDCTGTGVVTYTSGLVANVALVIIQDEIHFIGTDPDSSIKGIQKRR